MEGKPHEQGSPGGGGGSGIWRLGLILTPTPGPCSPALGCCEWLGLAPTLSQVQAGLALEVAAPNVGYSSEALSRQAGPGGYGLATPHGRAGGHHSATLGREGSD